MIGVIRLRAPHGYPDRTANPRGGERDAMDEKSPFFQSMYDAVLDGDDEAAEKLARDALAQGLAPLTAVDEGFVPGIREAGRLFGEGEYFLPELVTAAQAMKAAMAVLQPELAHVAQRLSRGRVVIGTAPGDIHDIGKTLVATMLSVNGFEVTDLGVDVDVERFVEEARRVEADFVCVSALLTTTMAAQRGLVTAVRDAGLSARVLVGGAPANREWAAEIGADGYAENAAGAVELALELAE